MSASRVFRTPDFLQPAEGEPIRSVITESDDAAVVAWHVEPGQRISAHVHPTGQDTWVILSGHGDYQFDVRGRTASVAPGDVVVAHRGEVHGVFNPGPEPLIFVSVVCPALSGFEPVSGTGAR